MVIHTLGHAAAVAAVKGGSRRNMPQSMGKRLCTGSRGRRQQHVGFLVPKTQGVSLSAASLVPQQELQ